MRRSLVKGGEKMEPKEKSFGAWFAAGAVGGVIGGLIGFLAFGPPGGIAGSVILGRYMAGYRAV